ncbi:GNAT family N-acetyltransferase [Saccharopolyspora phatthalungensis]|uniref:RimJ/RimL family protein N-acetyltransferase n=1 Tax=Saccharopolyspora phatthalungensis TaxID=664693 RepID=A0A840QHT3_9PSEU|nr:GNAT family N-acetyltransferase [Saccharopolyspora phatthalungensis]MBB5159757.1 RimJ/RimL family protein N-acetyltransferase [Saccharopolyspora phatthalungensis]
MQPPLITDRLIVRDWTTSDADVQAALALYGRPEVTEWLTPVIANVADLTAMRAVVQSWTESQPNLVPPTGRWAMQRRCDDAVVGGLVLRTLPPYDHDLELTWQLRPEAWGHGYATEAAAALLRWAFTYDIDEIFALARPDNTRAIATAERIGMEWVGETTKYYDTALQVYRIRQGDLPNGPASGRTED